MEGVTYLNELDFEVRDYECDLQGVVNNANYLHYLEHARHQWLQSLGVDFAALHREGIDLIVVRVEIDYKYPLRSRDRFVVRSAFQREGRLKLICNQDIYRMPDEKLIVQSRFLTTALQNGRPALPDVVMDKIAKVLGSGAALNILPSRPL
jgi:acyl-CoA thioester hydrolase